MKVLFVFLFFLSFEAAASFVAQPVAVPLQDVHVIDAITIGPDGTLTGAISGNHIIVLRMRAKIGTGTQSGRLRGFDSVVTLGGDATQTGTGASAFRGANMSVAQKSTNTAAELVGLNS